MVFGELPENAQELITKLNNWELDQQAELQQRIKAKREEVIKVLERMLQETTKTGDLDGAIAIKGEIERLHPPTESQVSTQQSAPPLGSPASKAVELVGDHVELEGGLNKRKDSKLAKWSKGGKATWKRATVNPGNYEIVFVGGGYRPYRHTMKLGIGDQTTEFTVYPNTGGNPSRQFRVGNVTITKIQKGVTLECVHDEPTNPVSTKPESRLTHLTKLMLNPISDSEQSAGDRPGPAS